MDELELLKEIEDLDKNIKTKELFTRDLRESDYDILVGWWKWWKWTPLAKDFLPKNGIFQNLSK